MVKLVSRITLDSSSSAAYRQHVFRPACPISAAAVVVSDCGSVSVLRGMGGE